MVTAVARGDAPRVTRGLPPSPLPGVSDEAWARFVGALEAADLNAISPSGSYGCFELRVRRLGDLGLLENVRTERTQDGRSIARGDFRPPLTEAAFLASYLAQYNTLCLSIARFDAAMRRGSIQAPKGIGRSEALAVLHRAGPGALRKWPTTKFENTAAAVARAAGIF